MRKLTQLHSSVSHCLQHTAIHVSFPSSSVTLLPISNPLPSPHPCHLTAQLIDDHILVSFPSWCLLHE